MAANERPERSTSLNEHNALVGIIRNNPPAMAVDIILNAVTAQAELSPSYIEALNILYAEQEPTTIALLVEIVQTLLQDTGEQSSKLLTNFLQDDLINKCAFFLKILPPDMAAQIITLYEQDENLSAIVESLFEITATNCKKLKSFLAQELTTTLSFSIPEDDENSSEWLKGDKKTRRAKRSRRNQSRFSRRAKNKIIADDDSVLQAILVLSELGNQNIACLKVILENLHETQPKCLSKTLQSAYFPRNLLAAYLNHATEIGFDKFISAYLLAKSSEDTLAAERRNGILAAESAKILNRQSESNWGRVLQLLNPLIDDHPECAKDILQSEHFAKLYIIILLGDQIDLQHSDFARFVKIFKLIQLTRVAPEMRDNNVGIYAGIANKFVGLMTNEESVDNDGLALIVDLIDYLHNTGNIRLAQMTFGHNLFTIKMAARIFLWTRNRDDADTFREVLYQIFTGSFAQENYHPKLAQVINELCKQKENVEFAADVLKEVLNSKFTAALRHFFAKDVFVGAVSAMIEIKKSTWTGDDPHLVVSLLPANRADQVIRACDLSLRDHINFLLDPDRSIPHFDGISRQLRAADLFAMLDSDKALSYLSKIGINQLDPHFLAAIFPSSNDKFYTFIHAFAQYDNNKKKRPNDFDSRITLIANALLHGTTNTCAEDSETSSAMLNTDCILSAADKISALIRVRGKNHGKRYARRILAEMLRIVPPQSTLVKIMFCNLQMDAIRVILADIKKREKYRDMYNTLSTLQPEVNSQTIIAALKKSLPSTSESDAKSGDGEQEQALEQKVWQVLTPLHFYNRAQGLHGDKAKIFCHIIANWTKTNQAGIHLFATALICDEVRDPDDVVILDKQTRSANYLSCLLANKTTKGIAEQIIHYWFNEEADFPSKEERACEILQRASIPEDAVVREFIDEKLMAYFKKQAGTPARERSVTISSVQPSAVAVSRSASPNPSGGEGGDDTELDRAVDVAALVTHSTAAAAASASSNEDGCPSEHQLTHSASSN